MKATYLNLDNAWGDVPLDIPARDATAWGPRLRYIARKADIEAFWRDVSPGLGEFILYGSGDFHHLAGVLIRRASAKPLTLLSFDNHPDWDIRPPYWSCGGWAARTLYAGQVERVSVWGCGNFELRWPARLFADRRALREGKLEIHAWAERQNPAVQKRFNCMTRDNWRERFEHFAVGLRGESVYITVDMDCLSRDHAVTNWEAGLFTANDIAWAIHMVRKNANVIAGDLCGAYSPPAYARFTQRLAGRWDHPKLPPIDVEKARITNYLALQTIWPAMIQPV